MEKKHITFEFPEGVMMIRIIDEILTSNGLKESDGDFFEKDQRGEEPKSIIIRDAAYVMAEKKVPEKKIIDLLVEHLETTPETAQKIVAEINEKLIPFAKIVIEKPEEEVKVEDFSEALVEEIQRKQAEPEPQPDAPKPVIPKPVAPKPPTPPPSAPQENIPTPPKEVSKVKTVLPPEAAKPNPADTYREPIE